MSALLHNNELWVAIAFVLIVALAWRPAHKRLGAILDERAALVKGELDEAQRLREEAERALAEFQRNQRDALRQAEQIATTAREEAERAAESARRDLEAALERRRRIAAERIALDERRAAMEVRNLAVDVAVSALRRMLAQDLDAARRDALVDQAIKALPQQLS